MEGKRVKMKNVWRKEISQEWCIWGKNGEYHGNLWRNKGSLLIRIQNTDIMALVRDFPEYMPEVGVKHAVHLWLGTEQVGSFMFWMWKTGVPTLLYQRLA